MSDSIQSCAFTSTPISTHTSPHSTPESHLHPTATLSTYPAAHTIQSIRCYCYFDHWLRQCTKGECVGWNIANTRRWPDIQITNDKCKRDSNFGTQRSPDAFSQYANQLPVGGVFDIYLHRCDSRLQSFIARGWNYEYLVDVADSPVLISILHSLFMWYVQYALLGSFRIFEKKFIN